MWRERRSRGEDETIEFERGIGKKREDGEYEGTPVRVRLCAVPMSPDAADRFGVRKWKLQFQKLLRENTFTQTIGSVGTESEALGALFSAMSVVNDAVDDETGRLDHGRVVEELRSRQYGRRGQ